VFFLVKFLIRWWNGRRAGAGSAVVPVAATAATGASSASTRSITRPDGRSAASRGTLALIAHQVHFDLLASWRNPRARYLTLVFPLVFLFVFNGVFGNGHTTLFGHRVGLHRFYVPGILALSVVVTSYASLVVSITTLRQTGVFKRRRATPTPAALLITGQALSTVVMTFFVGAVLLIVSRLVFSVGFGLAPILAMAVIVLLGTVTFACIAYAVAGLIGTPDAAQPVVQATMLPLYFISGVFIPNTSLSPALKTIAKIFPVEHIANSLHLASVNNTFSGSISLSDVLILVAWAAVAGGFSAWKFSWLPSR
jgi:ABC-2 type transport system permease protein